MSKNPRFYFQYITLAFICQALAFFSLFSANASASESSLLITCPEELKPNISATCTVTVDTDIEINKIYGNFYTEDLNVSEFATASPWTVNTSSYSLDTISSSIISNKSTVGTFKITPKTPDSTAILLIENLVFEYSDKYSYSVASPVIEIKILPEPELPVCADDEELVGDICTKKCAENEERIDGVCIEKVIECEDGEELIDGKCVQKCAKDEERLDGKCTKKCAANEERIDGVCVVIKCAENEELVDGVCIPKVATPTCKTGEILVNNKCEKKKDSIMTIVIVAIISSIILAGIITLIIVIKKRKKEEKEEKNGTYLSTGGGGSSSPTTNYQAKSPAPSKAPLQYDNGSYLARSSTVAQTQQTPKRNDDPKLQMQMQNPAEGMQRKTGATTDERVETNTPVNPSDPRLQIRFANRSEEMKLKPTEATPILTSDYTVANQAIVPEDITPTETQTIIQAQSTVAQPVGPIANKNLAATPTVPVVEPTKSVALSKPTTPDVFES